MGYNKDESSPYNNIDYCYYYNYKIKYKYFL